jgi:hypothetical protein
MNNSRFALTTVIVFCAAFAGIAFGMPWLSKNYSAASRAAQRSAPAQPAAVAARVSVPDTPAPPKADAAPVRTETSGDTLARTALQAAQAYAGAPCDQMAKAAFIVAASTYLRAQDASPQAPKDARVYEAIKTALENGNVSRDDFPPDIVMAGGFPAAPSRESCVNWAGLQP